MPVGSLVNRSLRGRIRWCPSQPLSRPRAETLILYDMPHGESNSKESNFWLTGRAVFGVGFTILSLLKGSVDIRHTKSSTLPAKFSQVLDGV